MNAYRLKQVSFAYDGGPAVLALPDLAIPAGRATAFVGPNGSGKTTLLHLLAFLTAPSSGSVSYFGEPVTPRRLPQLRREVCLLLQVPYLFRRSVQANVEWGLRVRSRSRQERRRIARQALERVRLEALADRPASDLSGGERQRAALARVIALRPRVVCLDEPTNHLDGENQRTVEGILREWLEKEGVTVVMATHDEGFAHRLGAEVWGLEAGALQARAEQNVFPGRLVGPNGRTFQAHGIELQVSGLPADTPCVRIDPRHILLARTVQHTSARNQLPGRITEVRELPHNEVQVTVECGAPLVALITRESWRELGLAEQGEVVASFKASAVRPC